MNRRHWREPLYFDLLKHPCREIFPVVLASLLPCIPTEALRIRPRPEERRCRASHMVHNSQPSQYQATELRHNLPHRDKHHRLHQPRTFHFSPRVRAPFSDENWSSNLPPLGVNCLTLQRSTSGRHKPSASESVRGCAPVGEHHRLHNTAVIVFVWQKLCRLHGCVRTLRLLDTFVEALLKHLLQNIHDFLRGQ